MNDPNWTSVLPPVLAIVLAIVTRQVYLSLAAGIWFGWTIVAGWNPLLGLASAIEGVVGVFADAGNTRVLLFTLVIGALIATVEASGGVRGFVSYLEQRNWVNTPRRSRLLAYVVGIIIFIESNITCLVAGAVARPLFDRYRISREKLAYIIDATSAAVCILIPLNAWGAHVLAILNQLELESPLEVLVASIPFNFYALGTVLLAGIVAAVGLEIGPMRKAQRRTREGQILWPGATPMIDTEIIAPPSQTTIPPRARNMFLPIATMVVMMPISLLITAYMQTGQWDLRRGSGSTSVLWAVLAGLGVAWLMLLAQRAFKIEQLVRVGLRGAGGLVSLALVLLLALALAAVTGELKTGRYIAQLAQETLAPAALLPLVFIVAAVTGFCTGTSWGTFAIMLPMAVPAAAALDLPVAPFVAAVLSGGVFGDHASPISDTTIISSMAAATDHIDHVRTQLPYALIAAVVAAIGFTLVGAIS
jgi:tetracycline resistance efflux pump